MPILLRKLLLVSLIAMPIIVDAQDRAAIDVSALGPQVGDLVPDFNLLDQKGESRNLQSIMGPNGIILLFHCSADW